MRLETSRMQVASGRTYPTLALLLLHARTSIRSVLPCTIMCDPISHASGRAGIRSASNGQCRQIPSLLFRRSCPGRPKRAHELSAVDHPSQYRKHGSILRTCKTTCATIFEGVVNLQVCPGLYSIVVLYTHDPRHSACYNRETPAHVPWPEHLIRIGGVSQPGSCISAMEGLRKWSTWRSR